MLEEDIGLTNIALDLIGQARLLFSYAGELGGKGRTEDELAFLRDSCDFRNLLLVEQPNRDFGYTIARQFFFDAYNLALYERLCESSDRRPGPRVTVYGDGRPTSEIVAGRSPLY